MLVGVAGLLLGRAPISLMDEPTNNLDRRARDVLYAAVETWPGVLIVVSHDRELLERVDEIVELRDGTARTFGGPYSTYADIVAAEQATAARLVRSAEGEVAREKRQLIETQVKLARRLRTAKKAELEKRVPEDRGQQPRGHRAGIGRQVPGRPGGATLRRPQRPRRGAGGSP